MQLDILKYTIWV